MIAYPEYQVVMPNGLPFSTYSEKQYSATPGSAYLNAKMDFDALKGSGAKLQMHTVKVSEWETIDE